MVGVSFYGIGLRVSVPRVDGFGRSQLLAPEEVLKRIPTPGAEGPRGGVLYHDGQFDDCRLLINLAQTAGCRGHRQWPGDQRCRRLTPRWRSATRKQAEKSLLPRVASST